MRRAGAGGGRDQRLHDRRHGGTGGAIIYYGRGDLPALLAAPAVLGVQLGSWAGLRLAGGIPAKWLKVLLTVVLVARGGADVLRSGR